MFTQLSLFDLPGQLDSISPLAVRETGTRETGVWENSPPPQAPADASKSVLEPIRIYGDSRPQDSIQPMGDLARLVIARYEMVARRREEMMRRKAENPRKSIRVLSPA